MILPVQAESPGRFGGEMLDSRQNRHEVEVVLLRDEDPIDRHRQAPAGPQLVSPFPPMMRTA